MQKCRRIERYIELIKQYPHLFKNDPNPSSIQIITDFSVIMEQQAFFYQVADNSGKPREWFDIGVLSEDEWVLTLRDLVIMPGGTYGRYIRQLNKSSVVRQDGTDIVVLVYYANQIVLLNHFRHELRNWSWEIPRGFGESHLTPEENVRKEIMEETGLKVDKLVQIGGESQEGILNGVMFYVAYTSGQIQIEQQEGIRQFVIVSPGEFKEMIRFGKIFDPYTIQAYAFAQLRGEI